ncbi:hypothetical protein ORIO_12595 [Cereibacter azotoformans]|uniref:hypothetical protein n=1 Tax=Cereibacter azotoformans TaxID=43057 RepID=UPI001EEC3433|nr:hypothetical protein [Cereibacter azotoformans]ULB10742.1 hypothetical protein ORIO_12595 [Cereibacter azotoformans]
MHIKFAPQRRDDALTLARSGDTLTINGETLDLSAIPEGATLPREAVACEWLASDIERIGGVLHLTLILPHGADAPQEVLFPAPVLVEPDGPIALPGDAA